MKIIRNLLLSSKYLLDVVIVLFSIKIIFFSEKLPVAKLVTLLKLVKKFILIG